MRRHYESLNYLDGQPNSAKYRFSRTAGSEDGVLASNGCIIAHEAKLTRGDVRNLRDMLNEILEDWQ